MNKVQIGSGDREIPLLLTAIVIIAMAAMCSGFPLEDRGVDIGRDRSGRIDRSQYI